MPPEDRAGHAHCVPPEQLIARAHSRPPVSTTGVSWRCTALYLQTKCAGNVHESAWDLSFLSRPPELQWSALSARHRESSFGRGVGLRRFVPLGA
jgi:hypothetical protein